MNRIRYAAPHTIDPSLVEIGDEIVVEIPKNRGIITYVKGIVGDRIEHGELRIYVTTEGGTLFTWQPNKPKPRKILLYSRLEVTNDTLFEMVTDPVKERISI